MTSTFQLRAKPTQHLDQIALLNQQMELSKALADGLQKHRNAIESLCERADLTST